MGFFMVLVVFLTNEFSIVFPMDFIENFVEKSFLWVSFGNSLKISMHFHRSTRSLILKLRPHFLGYLTTKDSNIYCLLSTNNHDQSITSSILTRLNLP